MSGEILLDYSIPEFPSLNRFFYFPKVEEKILLINMYQHSKYKEHRLFRWYRNCLSGVAMFLVPE
jgi:hypothetical protein